MVNRRLLRRQFADWATGHAKKVLWLYSPLDYDLAAHADVVIYHCVDLLGEVPGIDSEMIFAAEKKLAARGTVIAAGSSPAVVEHLRACGFGDPIYWPNVADAELFAFSGRLNVERRPAAVFAGNMTPSKVDFSLLHHILEQGVELHLAGPIAEGGGDARQQVSDLTHAGAIYHGLLSLDELARLQSECAVGLIPYVSNTYTAGVSPLKTFEYLASGLAVVSTGVPSVQPIPGMVWVTCADSYVASVMDARNQVLDEERLTARIALSEHNSWLARGEAMRSVVSDALERIK